MHHDFRELNYDWGTRILWGYLHSQCVWDRMFDLRQEMVRRDAMMDLLCQEGAEA